MDQKEAASCTDRVAQARVQAQTYPTAPTPEPIPVLVVSSQSSSPSGSEICVRQKHQKHAAKKKVPMFKKGKGECVARGAWRVVRRAGHHTRAR